MIETGAGELIVGQIQPRALELHIDFEVENGESDGPLDCPGTVVCKFMFEQVCPTMIANLECSTWRAYLPLINDSITLL